MYWIVLQMSNSKLMFGSALVFSHWCRISSRITRNLKSFTIPSWFGLGVPKSIKGSTRLANVWTQFVKQPKKTFSGYVNVAAFSVIFNSQHEGGRFFVAGQSSDWWILSCVPWSCQRKLAPFGGGSWMAGRILESETVGKSRESQFFAGYFYFSGFGCRSSPFYLYKIHIGGHHNIMFLVQEMMWTVLAEIAETQTHRVS